MSSSFESKQDKTIPLSQAHAKRRENTPIETSAIELEEIFTRVFNKEVTGKIVRLEKSIDRMVAQFEAIRNGEAEDAALRVTTDMDSTDIALANIQLNQEDYYPYTCGMIAKKLGVSQHKVSSLIKKIGIRRKIPYHKEFQIGVKSFVHKYSEAALNNIKKEL